MSTTASHSMAASRQRISQRHIWLVDICGQQLVCRISGRCLSVERRDDPDRDAAVDHHADGADSPLATTTLNTIAEFNYALNEDETRDCWQGSSIREWMSTRR